MSATKLLRVIALTLILLVTLVGQGQAQGQEPPRPVQLAAYPPAIPPVTDGQKGGIPIGARTVSDVNTNAVTLGAPGLSFRYVQTFGVSEEAYPADVQHLNGPNGLFIDGNNNLYVAEELGSRMLKYRTSDGANLLSIGTPGMRYTDNYVYTWLEDVTLDGDGNIWVADNPSRVAQYDAHGNFLQQLPAVDPWSSGNDDTHFSGAVGIAFDSNGRMYVSDRENNRIQVYDFVGGSPVYSATIGETGVPGDDNTHFNSPNHIAIDSSNRLYVPDALNNRVQRCTFADGWSCVTFHGTGIAGSGDNELNNPTGIAFDSSNNVYIADRDNNRIKKCSIEGICSIFATGPDWMHDVAVDSSGNVYTGAWRDSTIRKYNSNGVFQGVFAGATGEPYSVDTTRLNTPSGISVTADGSLLVTEDRGARLVKLNAAGTQMWAAGQAGVSGSDNVHFGGGFPSMEGNPAVDNAGHIYVADTGNNRVQIFNSNGFYSATFGGPGNGNYQFQCPSGVTINPVNGDIYVTDSCNNRVQVYSSSRVYKTRLGSGIYGSSNTEFANPKGVAIDNNGNIYVADLDNSRVQKCTLSVGTYNCTTFAGVTGESGADFGHLSGPYSVSVDAAGRVYVADTWNSRIQVFDSTGAYLTTINGLWGANSGQFRNPRGVALDSQGNIYVTDSDNHRVQKFVPGTPNWVQKNINGFGDPGNLIGSLDSFGGQLYAGTLDNNGGTAQLWRSSGDQNWSPVMTDGFGDATNTGIDHLIEFNGMLYAGIWNGSNTGPYFTNGGQVWRSPTGDPGDWSKVVDAGFGDPRNGEVFRMVVFNNQLYASTWSYSGDHGSDIWRTNTGNVGDWTQVMSNGFNNDTNNDGVISFEPFNGHLYAGTNNQTTGGEVWRFNNGSTWIQVNTDGFGTTNNRSINALAAFNGYLFAGVRGLSGVSGAEVWRCQVCNGSDWMKVVNNGFGNVNTYRNNALEVLGNRLYFVVGNEITGMEVWRTSNGASWEQVGFAGFGDSNNNFPYWDNSITVFNDRLFIGTINMANGGEIWQLLNKIYLPLVIR